MASDAEGGGRLLPAEAESLYLLYSVELRAFLLGVLRNPDLAHEALQNTFQRLLEAGHTSRAETRKGWLFKVAFHEAMALRRKCDARERALLRYGELRSKPESRPAEGSAQEQEIITRETVLRLKQELAELPAEQRVVVERRMYRDETFAKIAAELGIPLGTVLTRMRLAMQKLERHLKVEHDNDRHDGLRG